ncbi:MAG: hypothetical protein DWQ07_12015 [Chloroflexi bacterium]|nr:MAG: hypothetical protein DWQ07_12015 [Chloroflexota bacterium]MBL1196084.1 hypothetical protein [Chloroflexota bacterium]NOH13377.1 hypothetical protein [Chloroflexota bacterium]
MSEEDPLIGIVGPCKAGKSTLAQNLIKRGYRARQIVQEHSFAPSMWQKITNPDFLVYLDISYEQTVTRGGMNWMKHEYEEQLTRLAHARKHAHIYIHTDTLSPEQTLKKVIGELG